MRFIGFGVSRAADALTLVGGVCLVLMMLQTVADVTMRYVFNAPIYGTVEVASYYYMVGVVFLPLAMIELRHQHINVTLVVQLLPKRWQSYIFALGCVVAATFYGLLAYQTFWDAVRATRIGESMMGAVHVMIWPSRWALPIGFFLIAVAVLLNALAAVRDPEGFDPSPADEDQMRKQISGDAGRSTN